MSSFADLCVHSLTYGETYMSHNSHLLSSIRPECSSLSDQDKEDLKVDPVSVIVSLLCRCV